MAEFKEELEQLTERIAAERRRIRSEAQRTAPQLQRGETGNAQNILAAQQRAAAAGAIPHTRESHPNRGEAPACATAKTPTPRAERFRIREIRSRRKYWLRWLRVWRRANHEVGGVPFVSPSGSITVPLVDD
jgi:hypothetical protein